jgi:membrane dipeptidase
MRLVLPVLLLAAAMIPGQTASSALLERARALQKEAPLIDGHNDYPWAVRETAQWDLDRLDIRGSRPGLMTDIPRLRAGGVGGQFWSVYVPVELQGQTAVTATLEQIDVVQRMMKK